MVIFFVCLVSVRLWLAAKRLLLPLIMMQSYRQSEFCVNSVSRNQPPLGGLPHLETFTWQNLTPAERVTRSGRPGYPPWRVTPPIKLKCEIIWTGGLPHLPGVPHLRVNRPLGIGQMSNFSRDEPNSNLGRLK